MASFVITLVLLMGLQIGLKLVLFNVFHLSILWVEIIIDVVLGFVFAIINYRGGSRKDAIKDPLFHRSFAIYTGVFLLITFIYLWINR